MEMENLKYDKYKPAEGEISVFKEVLTNPDKIVYSVVSTRERGKEEYELVNFWDNKFGVGFDELTRHLVEYFPKKSQHKLIIVKEKFTEDELSILEKLSENYELK